MPENFGEKVSLIQELADRVEGVLRGTNFIGLELPSGFGGEGFPRGITGFMVSNTCWAENEEHGGETCRHILIFADEGIAIILEKKRDEGNVYLFQCWLSDKAIKKYGIDSPLFNIATIKDVLNRALEVRATQLEHEVGKVRDLIMA